MGKYDPLAQYMREQPAGASDITLSFPGIEGIIGESLPESARLDRTWWGNTTNSRRVQSAAWLSAGWEVVRVDLAGEVVVFARTARRMSASASQSSAGRGPRKLGSLYANLTAFLKQLPAAQEQLALNFDELAGIIGQPLPPAAASDRPWWANTTTGSQGAAWMSAGWKVESVYLPARIVVFRRRGEDLVRAIPKYVQLLLDGSRQAGALETHRLARWIRFCRRVGWYFQGTTLYEKSGFDIALLDEVEQAEIEEDYAVCKRELLRYKQIERR